MGFVAANLRVVLLSTHVPLSEAIRMVQRERVEKRVRLAHHELRRWGIERPRLAVAALNPHGAEGGLFGVEEASEMVPAIEACRVADDINVTGPFPADTVFLRASRGEFDAVFACYHDQAMIPVKCLSFGEAVNVLRQIAGEYGADAIFLISEQEGEKFGFGASSGEGGASAHGGTSTTHKIRAKAIVWVE